ncbi:MAG: ACT domain-containing protein [Arenicella sp.]|jgi:hypothetical protein|nr:ACT domain-containing protein [Arenicella sp.]HAU67108.1 transporter [Gammaproteobacteria bacterium]
MNTVANGEKDLNKLLANLEPVLDLVTYVFCTTDDPATDCSKAIATFREDEGLTLILEQEFAKAKGFDDQNGFRRLTLKVHSSLNAVGLTAAIAEALTRHNISANVMAAFYHDHVFVPEADAERALEVLRTLAES